MAKCSKLIQDRYREQSSELQIFGDMGHVPEICEMCPCLPEKYNENVSGIEIYSGCFSNWHIDEDTENNDDFSGRENTGKRSTGHELYGDTFSSQKSSAGCFRGWENYEDNFAGSKNCGERLPGKDNHTEHFSGREIYRENVSSLQIYGDSLFSGNNDYEQNFNGQERCRENWAEVEKYRDRLCCWECNGECFTGREMHCYACKHGEDGFYQKSHEGSVAGEEDYKNHFAEQDGYIANSAEMRDYGQYSSGQANIGESFGWQHQYTNSFAGRETFFDNMLTPFIESAGKAEQSELKGGDKERNEKETQSNVKKLEDVLIRLNQNGWKERWIRNSAEKLQEVLISLSQEVGHEEQMTENPGELQEMLIRKNLDERQVNQIQCAIKNENIPTNLNIKEGDTKDNIGEIEEEGENKSGPENLPAAPNESFSAMHFGNDSPGKRKDVHVQSNVEKSQKVVICANPSKTKEEQIKNGETPQQELTTVTDEPVKLSQSQKRRKRRKRLRARLFAKSLQQSLDQEELESSGGKMICDMKFIITAVVEDKNDDDDGVCLYGMSRP